MTTDPAPLLSNSQRTALSDELFALHRALEPDANLCFCGSDADLIDGVNDLRGRAAELGDDR